MDVLSVALWLNASIKVLKFVFRRMKLQLVKSLPSCCEMPSIRGAAAGGKRRRRRAQGTVSAPAAALPERAGTAGEQLLSTAGAQRLQGARCLSRQQPGRLARRNAKISRGIQASFSLYENRSGL